MKNTQSMRGVHAVGDLTQQSNGTFYWQGTLSAKQAMKGFAFNVFHYEIERALFGLAKVGDADSVGMLDRCRSLRFPFEAGDGFTVGVHTWDHPDMTKLSPQQREWELAATAQAIHSALGADYCLSFWRPPFGDYDDAIVAQADSLGLSTVTWDVDSQDYLTPGVQLIVDRVLSTVHPGAIILLHDGDHSRWQTAQALPLIITGLKQRGYIPVTLPVLLAGG